MQPALAPPRDELDDVCVPLVVKVAGGAAMATGAFTAGLAIQTALVFRMTGKMPIVVAAMAALGITAVVAGFRTLRGSGGAAVASAVAGGLVTTLGALWAVVGLLSGLVSPLSWGIVPCGIATTALAAIAVPPARRVSLARVKMRT